MQQRDCIYSQRVYKYSCFHFQGNHKGAQKKKKQGGKPTKSPSATYHGNNDNKVVSSFGSEIHAIFF